MYGILISAFNSVLGWTFKTVIMKFVVFTVIYLVVSTFIGYIVNSGILPNLSNVQSQAGSIPASVAYMFSIFQIWTGMSMIITAYMTRFMIRRIPFIG